MSIGWRKIGTRVVGNRVTRRNGSWLAAEKFGARKLRSTNARRSVAPIVIRTSKAIPIAIDALARVMCLRRGESRGGNGALPRNLVIAESTAVHPIGHSHGRQ